MPVAHPMLFNATAMAECIPYLKAGNLHLNVDTMAQAEYLICGAEANGGSHPRLLATCVPPLTFICIVHCPCEPTAPE